MLTSMGAEIPLLTRMLLLLTSFLTSPLGWAAMLMGTVCAWLSLKAMWALPGGRVAMTRLLLAVPVLGPLLKAGTLSRYAAAAETMSQCGTDLFTVTRLSATASGNSLIQTDVPRLAKAISDGHSLSAHMGDNPDIYSSLFAQLCGVGEESARMTEMFGFLRNYYEEEVNHRLGAVTALMEPLIMAVLALIVGLVVIALILPLHSFLSSLM
jgi:type IV pilus assembly protein PilC